MLCTLLQLHNLQKLRLAGAQLTGPFVPPPPCRCSASTHGTTRHHHHTHTHNGPHQADRPQVDRGQGAVCRSPLPPPPVPPTPPRAKLTAAIARQPGPAEAAGHQGGPQIGPGQWRREEAAPVPAGHRRPSGDPQVPEEVSGRCGRGEGVCASWGIISIQLKLTTCSSARFCSTELLIRKLPFQRLVREIAQDFKTGPPRAPPPNRWAG